MQQLKADRFSSSVHGVSLHRSPFFSQAGEPPGSFSNAGPHFDGRVQIPGLRPELPRLRHLACIAF